MKWSYCLALVLALPIRAPAAQNSPTLARGARVRVTTPDARGWVVGTLESVDSTSIVLRRENGEAAVLPRGRTTQVDVSAGPGSCSPGHRARCVLVGFLIGAGVTAAVAELSWQNSTSEAPEGVAVLMLAVPGALVGTIVGALRGGEHWNSIELPVRLTLTPGRPGSVHPGRGVRVGVRLAF